MQYEEFVLLRSFAGDKSCKTTDAFNLGKLYFKRGEYSPALYFFSSAAETSVDFLLSYECLMMISLCLRGQGNKEISRMNAIDGAIELYPLRPEAHYLKSRCYLENEMYDDCLTCIKNSYDKSWYMGPDFRNGRHDQTVLISWNISYFGHSHYQFVKGMAHYYKGENESALKCFNEISNVAAMDLPPEDYSMFSEIYKKISGK